MPTAGELIDSALSKIGVLNAGETADAEDAAVGLTNLNTLVDAWENEGMYAYTTTDTTFTLPAATVSRTIGPSMQINMTRPVRILEGSFTRADGKDYPLRPITEAEYNSIGYKSDYASTAPDVCFYDGGVPTGNVYFWPPTVGSVEVHLITPEAGGSATSLTTNFVFPPGYRLAIEANLAVEVAPYFNIEPPPRLLLAAQNSKRLLKRTNSRVPQMETPDFTVARPDIFAGE